MSQVPPNTLDLGADLFADKQDAVAAADVQLVFDIWKAHSGVRNLALIRLNDRRSGLIRRALAARDRQTVLDAVVGWRYSGMGSQGGNADSLEMVLRDNVRIDQFAGYTRDAGVSAPTEVPAGMSSREVSAADIQLVFDIWKTYTSSRNMAQMQINDRRRSLIRQALSGYDRQTVLDAVVGWRYSEFHSGKNERKKVYNSLELILRDGAHVEQFAGYTRDAGVSAPTEVPAEPVAPVPAVPGPGVVRLGVFEYSGEW